MKLVIQIPAFNEERTIARTIADLPKRIDGIHQIEVLVVDDGSSDGTAAAARAAGAGVLRLMSHRGLSAAFVAGLTEALQIGADVIVNTDADNQYAGADIANIVQPILDGSADVVIGDRGTGTSPHMGPFKRLLQRIGSGAVGIASGLDVPDATSGLRAFSRDAAFQINVFNPFTYTLETIIQSGNRNLELRSVPIRTNPPTRPSRLYSGILSYVRKSIVTIFRVYTIYKPLKTFFLIGTVLFLTGLGLGGRFLFFYLSGSGAGHVQSLILTAVLLILGFQTATIGLVADLISVNRRLSEEILIRMRKLERPRHTRSPQRPRVPDMKGGTEETADTALGTNWVWLMDESRLGERQMEEVAAVLPSSPSKRRRRRRGGMRPDTEGQKAPRDRMPHAPPREHGGEPPTETPPQGEE